MASPAARTPAHPIEPLFVERWSPRAFEPGPISQSDTLRLLEAARWAPSSFNAQPWRFLYAHRDTPAWGRFLDLLVPFNRSWAQNASLMLLCLSETMMPPGPDSVVRPSHSHSFDSGAAWALLALQASRMGLAAHGMTGVDFDRARTELAIPDTLRVECAIVVGRPGDPASLPEPLRAREAPSDRRPLESFAFEGALPSAAP